MPDEAAAIEEIRRLSPEARAHLQHVWRNGLQVIAGAVETRRVREAREEVLRIAEELRRLGL